MIECFSGEIQEKMKHYVYRLVDPRNGKTFYVGEGCGNRVFAHANAVDLSFYKSEAVTEQDERTEENDDPAKIKKIMEIKKSGLSVVHIIQRWGMDQKTAFEVESAFIDFFGLQDLTNIKRGHRSERGMRSTYEIVQELGAPVFEENSAMPKFILIKINDFSIEQNGGNNPEGIYKAVRGNWVLNQNKANRYPYVLAVRRGIVVGVYKVEENGWKKATDSNRIYFDGKEAPKDIQELFLHKRIPEKYQKRQNPAGYCAL